jgi:hypothetical protein
MLSIEKRVVVAMAIVMVPRLAFAQLRVSVGAGAGIAGGTDGSLSEGRSAPVVMAQVSTSSAVGLGIEADAWLRSGSNVSVATGDVQLRIPSTSLFIKLGGGFGRGDPDGKGTVDGTAGHIGAAYDVNISGSRFAMTLFANGFVVYTASRSLQMVDGGLAITRR